QLPIVDCRLSFLAAPICQLSFLAAPICQLSLLAAPIAKKSLKLTRPSCQRIFSGRVGRLFQEILVERLWDSVSALNTSLTPKVFTIREPRVGAPPTLGQKATKRPVTPKVLANHRDYVVYRNRYLALRSRSPTPSA